MDVTTLKGFHTCVRLRLAIKVPRSRFDVAISIQVWPRLTKSLLVTERTLAGSHMVARLGGRGLEVPVRFHVSNT